MKRFYRLLCALLVAGALVAAACSESGTDDTPKEVEFVSGTDTKQQVFADDTEPAPIRFTAKAAWTATVTAVQTKAEGGSSVDWLTLDNYSGQAGEFSLKMTLEPNYTGTDRKAKIEIVCGGTSISITIEQKGTNEDGEMPHDPDKPGEPTPDNPDQPENPDDKGLLDADGNIQFPDAKFAAYMVGNFDTDGDGKISVEEATAITRIEHPGMEIESVEGIEYCTALTILYCSGNQLTALDVSKNTKLTELYCEKCQLTAIDVSKNMGLTGLYCSGNQLTALDVSKNMGLTGLHCSGNQLTALDVSKNTELTWLDCYENQLTALDVSKNTKLTHLDCGGNQLTTLDVSKNTKLTWLNCASNRLTALDVSNNVKLGNLHCEYNRLTSLDVSKNTELYSLYCGGNKLTALDVSKNTELTWLDCYENQLTALDVSKNTNLYKLHCGGNQLTTLDVSMMKLNKFNNEYGDNLSCNMESLKTLWLKTGWQLKGINKERSEKYIHPNTEIEYKD